MEHYTALLPPTGLLLWGVLCALQDARQRLISNWLTLGLCVLATGYLLLTGHSFTGSTSATVALGMILALLLSLPGYITGKMGAGDVKLLAALALSSSPAHVLGSVAIAAISMLLWALCGPALWRQLPPAVHQQLSLMNPSRRDRLPYAPFFLCGLSASVLWLH